MDICWFIEYISISYFFSSKKVLLRKKKKKPKSCRKIIIGLWKIVVVNGIDFSCLCPPSLVAAISDWLSTWPCEYLRLDGIEAHWVSTKQILEKCLQAPIFSLAPLLSPPEHSQADMLEDETEQSWVNPKVPAKAPDVTELNQDLQNYPAHHNWQQRYKWANRNPTQIKTTDHTIQRLRSEYYHLLLYLFYTKPLW